MTNILDSSDEFLARAAEAESKMLEARRKGNRVMELDQRRGMDFYFNRAVELSKLAQGK